MKSVYLKTSYKFSQANDGDWSKIRTGDQYLKSVIELFEAKIGG